jgi:hypothetical protein
MLRYSFIYTIIFLILSEIVPQKSIGNPVTDTEALNFVITYYPLIFVKQVSDCALVNNPKSPSDCDSVIIDERASCCYVSLPGQLNTCTAIPTSHPQLYKHVYEKLGITLDCPLINNLNGPYNDTLIGHPLLPVEDAQTLVNNALETFELISPSQNCLRVADPVSSHSCSAANKHSKLKCCYLYGKDSDGIESVNTCIPVPTYSVNIYQKLLSYTGPNVVCDIK